MPPRLSLVGPSPLQPLERLGAGLLDHVRSGRIEPSETVVFLHTGGMPGLFAYSDEFGPAV